MIPTQEDVLILNDDKYAYYERNYKAYYNYEEDHEWDDELTELYSHQFLEFEGNDQETLEANSKYNSSPTHPSPSMRIPSIRAPMFTPTLY